MKRKKILVLDEREEEIIKILQRLGYKKIFSRTLVYFICREAGCSADIEQTMNLRQPEVSLAVRELIQRGIVSSTSIPKQGKGRPIKVYKRIIKPLDIYKQIEEEQLENIKDIENSLDELRQLI